MNNALEGVTIVAIEQAVAAPYASSRLADAGARVIKVERASGDFARHYDTLVNSQSAYFVWLNRGKESICLNLKDENDVGLLRKIIAKADVVLQNLKPGSLKRLGLGHEALRKNRPDLITCNISGFGEAGEYAHLKAYDLIVQSEAGLCSITGSPGSPARVGVSVCDIAAGMSAHAAILQALFARQRTGKGCNIDISLFDAVADWMNGPYLQKQYGDRDTMRSGVHHTSLTPYGAYRCKDEVDIVFSVQNDREWVLFCKNILQDTSLTRDERFANNMSRLENRKALDLIVSQVFAVRPSTEIMDMLENADLAYGRLNDVSSLIKHPHLRTMPVQTENGQIAVIAPPQIYSDSVEGHHSVPSLGEHSQEIRGEFEGAEIRG
jgi:crotonobetainyl-CoA:carnitine CoA-transferase CaiB-like acyl-CoA transferase